MKRSIYLSCIASLAVFAFASATAEASTRVSAPRSVSVSIAGIDLDSAAGQRIVFRRLKRAARIVCSDLGHSHSLTRVLLYEKCVDDALARAATDVTHGAFREYAYGRLGRRPSKVVAAAR